MKNYLGSILLSGLFLLLTPAFSQTVTKAIGNYSVDYLFDMVSHGNKSYVYGNFGLNKILPQLRIGDTTFNMGCYKPSICVLDENMNLLDYTCFVDTLGYYKGAVDLPGKIAYDPLYGYLYITGTFDDNIIIGSDTLYSSYPGSFSFYIAKLDTNLTPIWARSTTCNYSWLNLDVWIKSMEIDGLGRPWVSLEVDQGGLICFDGDTIIEEGTVVYDTSGNSFFPIRRPAGLHSPTPFFNTMAVVDQQRMLVADSSYTQMVDVPSDTVIWEKPFRVQQVKVDTVNKALYTAYSGMLTKWDFMGNFLWGTPYASSSTATGIDLTENKDKIYVAGRTAGLYNKIFVLDSLGNFLDSMTWGIDPFYGHSNDVQLQSFQIENEKLKISYAVPWAKSVVFGMDTVKIIGQGDGILSFIDINNLLTSVQQKEMRASSSFNIYPNPNTGTFMLEGDGKIVQLDLYDLQGKHMQTVGSSSFKQISLSENLPSGLYFLRIKTAKMVEVVKLVLK